MNEQRQRLVRAYSDGSITPEQFRELEELLRNDAAARDYFLSERSIDAALEDAALEDAAVAKNQPDRVTQVPDTGAEIESVSPATNQDPRRSSALFAWALTAVVALALLAVTASFYRTQPGSSPHVARITGLGGSLMWTGDGGRIMKDLVVGTELSGGTIEGMVPDSWFELEFNDGSTVTISGHSMLTFSDYGQKELHLRKGGFSASVVPQPAGRPMLIHTRSALLEVLGTQFEVEAGLSSTVLNVSTGKVRVKRLSDGSTVDVPSRHRVIAAADRKMEPVRLPDAGHQWKSHLSRGPERTYGDWSPATVQAKSSLKAIPYTTKEGITVNAVGFGISTGDAAPVVLNADSVIRVHGRIADAHEIYFGVTVRHPSGEFAGRFHTVRSADNFRSGQPFVVDLSLREFELDPSSIRVRRYRLNESPGKGHGLADSPFNLTVESIWLHTLFTPAGLEVTEAELIPAATPAPLQPL